MRPAARVQAAIEILDRVIESARRNGPAADTIIGDWIRGHRYAGSKDKRAIREHVYAAIRAFGEMPESGRAAMLGLLGKDVDLFDGSPYGPAPIEDGELTATRSLLPAWLGSLIPEEDHEALLSRAPMDLRVNRAKAKFETILVELPSAQPIVGLPDAIRLCENIRIDDYAAWTEGGIEVQDAGSQWVVAASAVAPGMTVVDLCAGAGGKTLALAAATGGEGHLVACDTNRDRLQRLAPRAERAGVTGIETRLLNPGEEMQRLADLVGQADHVLIDAPCSGSGTLRRNPEARWRLTQERLDRLTALQAHVLELGAHLVKPGGTLVYAVCSLIEAEGAAQIDAFLQNRQNWEAHDLSSLPGQAVGQGKRLSPAHDGTDGFFIARLARHC
ncbi:RsmB/NOP family class I SAM-dependent RNA methyltransferase [Aquisediminimonas profunda]|uniref:RsmB/NOP family class I SAM-dependent RNA methyltransferase n=1 Tax=Aquisediminimonas profunda TaxID=1550733 RepID=UPI001C62E197|nr:RsmB/NOP family class I SAM-dependent RNA methyltransferase [Aquisediminimonas profunda]